MRDTTCSVPDAESRGRECAAPTLSNGNQNSVTSVSSFNQAQRYLVDQLMITATHLADSHIFRENPDLPFCTKCCISGLNGRPIQHLSSCAVGGVLRSIEDLR